MSRFSLVDRTGELVGDRYQIVNEVGRGGQSIVYRARDVRYGDEVAIKVLKGEFAENSEARERLFREAQAIMQLHGTAAIRILDQQWTQDGAPCLVQEFLVGQELEDALWNMEEQGFRASVKWVVDLLDPVVRTLEQAHGMGIVHRDLKPQNIFLLAPEAGGGVRLLDFGFAKFQRSRGLTADGMVAGSPSYIAPETWQGRKDLQDHRMDVYGMAAVIFRSIAGRVPFVAKDLVALLKAVTQAERPSLYALRPDLPPEVDDWVRMALAIDPNQRFVKIAGMWGAFRGIVGF
jgi:eukaryotic-like serine/threonine-protein kinase